MIASRLALSSFKFKPVLANSNVKTYGIIFRNFNTQSKENVVRRSLRTRFQGAKSGQAIGNTPINVGQMALAGASVLGIGSLAFYGLFSSNDRAIDRSSVWPQYVRDRISSTYSYFGSGLGITAASAYAVSRNATLMRISSSSSMLFMFASMATIIGSGMLTRSLPYQEGKFGAKNLAWAFHAGLLGAFVAPITLLGGPIVMKAAWMTAGIITGLSAIAATAPSEKFLNMGGPLAIGLGVVFASSIGSMFLPPTTKLGLSLYSMSIYGGLILFSMFLLYDTQKIVKKAEHQYQFDPINESISIYMDTINIFMRIASILAGGNRKK